MSLKANRRWDNILSITFPFLAVAAALISVIAQITNLWEFEFKDGHFVRKQVDLPARIEVLTKSLNSAAQTIGQIESEIKQRQELVAKLEKDAATASKVSALNKDQMEAVAQVLRTEIKSDERQNFWTAQLLAFFYAALGVALSEGYRYIIRWRLRRKSQSAG